MLCYFFSGNKNVENAWNRTEMAYFLELLVVGSQVMQEISGEPPSPFYMGLWCVEVRILPVLPIPLWTCMDISKRGYLSHTHLPCKCWRKFWLKFVTKSKPMKKKKNILTQLNKSRLDGRIIINLLWIRKDGLICVFQWSVQNATILHSISSDSWSAGQIQTNEIHQITRDPKQVSRFIGFI